MSTLSPIEIYTLIDSKAPNANPISKVVLTGIVLRESAGNPAATNTNKDGSIDRGLYQFNNKAHPNITDDIAFDPVKATEAAVQLSNGLTNFSPWKLSAGNRATYAANGVKLVNVGFGIELPQKVWTQIEGTVLSDQFAHLTVQQKQSILDKVGNIIHGIPGVGQAEDATAGAAETGVNTVKSVADFLQIIVSKVFSVQFWERVGLGALGVGIITTALVIMFKEPIEKNVGTVLKG